jgi:hypothetical protein
MTDAVASLHESLNQYKPFAPNNGNVDKLPLVRGTPRIGPCVGKVGNFIAVGLNYSDHAGAL